MLAWKNSYRMSGWGGGVFLKGWFLGNSNSEINLRKWSRNIEEIHHLQLILPLLILSSCHLASFSIKDPFTKISHMLPFFFVNHQQSPLFPPALSLSSYQLRGTEFVQPLQVALCWEPTHCTAFLYCFFVLPHGKGQCSLVGHMLCHKHHLALWRKKTTRDHLLPY